MQLIVDSSLAVHLRSRAPLSNYPGMARYHPLRVAESTHYDPRTAGQSHPYVLHHRHNQEHRRSTSARPPRAMQAGRRYTHRFTGVHRRVYGNETSRALRRLEILPLRPQLLRIQRTGLFRDVLRQPDARFPTTS